MHSCLLNGIACKWADISKFLCFDIFNPFIGTVGHLALYEETCSWLHNWTTPPLWSSNGSPFTGNIWMGQCWLWVWRLLNVYPYSLIILHLSHLCEAKKGCLQQQGVSNPSDSAIRKAINKEELSRHCRRRTRGLQGNWGLVPTIHSCYWFIGCSCLQVQHTTCISNPVYVQSDFFKPLIIVNKWSPSGMKRKSTLSVFRILGGGPVHCNRTHYERWYRTASVSGCKGDYFSWIISPPPG